MVGFRVWSEWENVSARQAERGENSKQFCSESALGDVVPSSKSPEAGWGLVLIPEKNLC